MIASNAEGVIWVVTMLSIFFLGLIVAFFVVRIVIPCIIIAILWPFGIKLKLFHGKDEETKA